MACGLPLLGSGRAVRKSPDRALVRGSPISIENEEVSVEKTNKLFDPILSRSYIPYRAPAGLLAH